MKLQPQIVFNNIEYNNRFRPQKHQINSLKEFSNDIGTFPCYYCPNIHFGSKFGEIDFEYDFYAKANDIIKNQLDEMELTKDLSEIEQEDFRKNLFACDKPTMLQFFCDKKPSVLLTGDFPYFENNEKYDFVRRTITASLKNNRVKELNNTFVINKELTKKTIEDNKELYTKRLGFEDESSVEDIYNTLVGESSPLKKQEGYDDIIGVTLGFSPINSILFQLEKRIPNYLDVRRQSYLHSEMLKKELYSRDSVYNNFSLDFISKISDAIDDIKRPQSRRRDLTPTGYSYIQFVSDDKHTTKIIRDSENILKNE